MLTPLVEIQARLAAHTQSTFRRYLFSAIDWNTRLFALIGPRGVGKTTMLLQFFKEEFGDPARCLYVSADNVVVQGVGLYEIASQHFREGGEMLLVDEVHRYPDWASQVKSIYDAFPSSRLALSGSSMLEILAGNADLSRRMVSYSLAGMSFREFIELETGVAFEPVSLETLLSDHSKLAMKITQELNVAIMGLFRRYLSYGVYPFYPEGEALYHRKLENILQKVFSEDIPAVTSIRPEAVPVLRRLVYLVASSQPFAPNIERMANTLDASRPSVYNYIDYLVKAGVLAALAPPGKGHKALRKPAKLYLDNPNLFSAVLGERGEEGRIGTVRETFFHHQVSSQVHLTADPTLDFRMESGQRFEVGGRSKTSTQREGDPNAWLAVDDTEVGTGHRIPLWLFGMLY